MTNDARTSALLARLDEIEARLDPEAHRKGRAIADLITVSVCAPLAVFFYGGSWQSGSRELYRFVGASLAAQGVVTVIPDYRVHPQARYPDFLEDAARAVRFARDNAERWNGNPRHLILMGHSAGAYNAAMLTYDKRWLNAVGLDPVTDVKGFVGLAGPYDFLPVVDPVLQTIFGGANRIDTQPIRYVSNGAPPALLVAPHKDRVVSPNNTKRLAAHIRGHRGKVRDVYEVDAETLLMIASDRVSAFDVVLPQPIPRKGEVLTLVTAWWLEQLDASLSHHLIAVDPDRIIDRHADLGQSRDVWARRAMLVHRTTPVLVECVVRGYIAGSAWKEYGQSGTLAGEALPKGMQESQRLDPPIFSPSTKAQEGEHDENITYGEVIELLGEKLAARLRDLSLRVYGHGRDVADKSDIILADTKFEFGFALGDDGEPTDEPILIDEVLTPDSSRFWPSDDYEPGREQDSYDKQYVRNYLQDLVDAGLWDKTPPGPDLPEEIVANTLARYEEARKRLFGKKPLAISH